MLSLWLHTSCNYVSLRFCPVVDFLSLLFGIALTSVGVLATCFLAFLLARVFPARGGGLQIAQTKPLSGS